MLQNAQAWLTHSQNDHPPGNAVTVPLDLSISDVSGVFIISSSCFVAIMWILRLHAMQEHLFLVCNALLGTSHGGPDAPACA